MKAVLDANGLIAIPTEIQAADHLAAGDSFEVERIAPGRYLLAKEPPTADRFTITTGADGLPLIRTTNGVITSRLVKEIEAQTS
jgi:bifunctional DNA-binding transcriptional regulator/antitoxin component of YhaV-PrlF toxin-antitoxin module